MCQSAANYARREVLASFKFHNEIFTYISLLIFLASFKPKNDVFTYISFRNLPKKVQPGRVINSC